MDNWTQIDHLENMGGVISIYYAPTFLIENFPAARRGVISDFITLASDSFSKAISTQKDVVFSENSKETSAGRIYNYEVTAFYPRLDPEVIAILEANASIPMVVKVQDANNNIRVLGSPDNPARIFMADGSTGQRPIDRNGIQYKITWQTNYMAPFYRPE